MESEITVKGTRGETIHFFFKPEQVFLLLFDSQNSPMGAMAISKEDLENLHITLGIELLKMTMARKG